MIFRFLSPFSDSGVQLFDGNGGVEVPLMAARDVASNRSSYVKIPPLSGGSTS